MKILVILLALLSVAASATPLSMKVGEKKQLAATKAGTPVSWVSSDAQVATVINSSSPKLNGMVIAHKPGTATVVASDHSETKVTVTAKPVTKEKKK